MLSRSEFPSPARPVPHPGGERSALISSLGADHPYLLIRGSISEPHLEDLRRTFPQPAPREFAIDERRREDERHAGAPLAAAAIIIVMTGIGFACGVIAAPAVRQLLAMVL